MCTMVFQSERLLGLFETGLARVLFTHDLVETIVQISFHELRAHCSKTHQNSALDTEPK